MNTRSVLVPLLLGSLLCLAEALHRHRDHQRVARHAAESHRWKKLPANPTKPQTEREVLTASGDVASEGQFPWQVSMVMDGSDFCSGAIVSDKWILTAGLCADGFQTYVVTVGSIKRFGGTDASKNFFLTSEAYRHPAYSGGPYYDNDISLIHLQKPIQFSEEVKPVRLPSYTMALESLVGKNTIVAGWGQTSDGSGTSTLMYATSPIAESLVCKKAYGNLMISTKICAATRSEYGQTTGPCNGDWGSPVVAETEEGSAVVVGIVSGNALEACTKGNPVMLTRVSSFLKFIESVTDIDVGE